MRIKTLLVMGVIAVSSAVLAGDRQWQLVGDATWLKSTECSVANTIINPDVGIIADQCELERMLKERLRQGPIELPASGGI